MSQGLNERAEPVWYVQAQGRVWGPYPESRIEAFVGEGRVSPAAMISPMPEGEFAPAGEQPELSYLFGRPEPAPARAATPQPQPITEPGLARPLLVFAGLTTLDEPAFEAALAIYGAYERVGRGLWLIRARSGPAALRNTLSRRLRGGDTLVVIEATLDQAAWFNLDQAEERKLRALWAG